MKEKVFPDLSRPVVQPLPDPRCASICRLATGEKCIEECAPKGDCAEFEVRPDLDILNMPKYPETKDMSWRARFVIQEAYTKKLVDHLQGVIDVTSILRRPLLKPKRHNGSNGHETLHNVLYDQKRDGVLPVREKVESKTVGPSEVDRDEKKETT